jgi:hypothetical protein
MTELEKALYELDKKEERDPAMTYLRVSTKHNENAHNDHTKLMNELKAKLKEYGEYAEKFCVSVACMVRH